MWFRLFTCSVGQSCFSSTWFLQTWSFCQTMGKKGSGEGLMNVRNLAKEWDEDETIRTRLRDGLDLLHPDSGPGEDIRTVLLNIELVTPMIVCMAEKPDKRPHPPIELLTEEVSTTYSLNKRVPLPVYSELRTLAWRLRWLACFVKSKAGRKEPSTDTLRQLVASNRLACFRTTASQFWINCVFSKFITHG